MSKKSDIVINVTDKFVVIKSKYGLHKLGYKQSGSLDSSVLDKVFEHISIKEKIDGFKEDLRRT